LDGGRFCGFARYRAVGTATHGTCCHRSICRRTSGAPFVVALRSDPVPVRLDPAGGPA
jgi:hypothetical protein